MADLSLIPCAPCRPDSASAQPQDSLRDHIVINNFNLPRPHLRLVRPVTIDALAPAKSDALASDGGQAQSAVETDILPCKTEQYLQSALLEAESEAPHAVKAIEYALTVAKAVVVPRAKPPARHSEEMLAEFRTYTKANPWDAKHDFTASQFIQHHYTQWLGEKDERGNWVGGTLYREDIVAVEPKLAAAYATEIRRRPERAIVGVYIRPHKLPHGSVRIVKPAADLTQDELARRRSQGLVRQERFQARKK